MNKKELRKILIKIHKEVANDKKHIHEREEYVKKYGMISYEDSRKVITK